jgi:LuxR family transcriptional regulator, maltose regulon positive regulatory protein
VPARTSAVPAPPDRLLPRPRLDERIHEATSARLLLVTASAGQGKTTAVAEALRSRPLAWVTLEDADRSPLRLLDHLRRALDGDTGGLAPITAPEPGDEPGDEPVEQLLRRLTPLGNEALFVLDDRTDAVRGASAALVANLLDRLPADAHLVLIARRRPAPELEIEQRRSRGEVAELLDGELAFTTVEAAGYLNHVWSLGLPDRTVRDLLVLTDGWPAALRLVASHLAAARVRDGGSAASTSAVERATAGLVDELLDRFGEAHRRVLRDAAILDAFDPATCGRITGYDEPTDLLERLAAAGLLRPSGDGSRTYRHRGLVRPRLLRDLHTGDPARERALHEVAAAWFAGTSDWTIAIGHAIAAGDHRWALDWLEANLEVLVTVEGGEWLRTVMASLGTAKVATRPRLLEAWLDVAMLRGDRTALERTLVDLEGASVELVGRNDALRRVRSYLSRLRGDGVEPLLVHRDHRPLDPRIAHPLGVALAAEGRHDAATAAFRSALDDARRSQEPFRELALLGDAAWQRAMAGHLVDADLLTRRAAELASRLGLGSPPLTATLATAQIALDRGRPEAARSQAAAVRALAAETCDLVLRVDAGLFVSRARWAQDDFEGAERSLTETDRELREHVPGGGLLSRIARARAGLRVALDDVHGAIATMPAITGNVEDLPPEDRLIAASVQLKLGSPERARAAIDTLRDAGIGPRLTVHALRIGAAACGLAGDLGEATRLRRDADRIARVGGLLTPIAHRHVPPPDRVATGRAEGRSAPAPAGTPIDQVEGITTRELDVLRMLRSATNVEIAAELYVSVNTVKTHLKSIYRKLGVASREAAVREARAVGLV